MNSAARGKLVKTMRLVNEGVSDPAELAEELGERLATTTKRLADAATSGLLRVGPFGVELLAAGEAAIKPVKPSADAFYGLATRIDGTTVRVCIPGR